MLRKIFVAMALCGAAISQDVKGPVVFLLNRKYVAVKPEISSKDPASEKYGNDTQNGAAYYNSTRFERRYTTQISVGSDKVEGEAFFDTLHTITKVTSTLTTDIHAPSPLYDYTYSSPTRNISLLNESITFFENGAEVNFTEFQDDFSVWQQSFTNFRFFAYRSDMNHRYENVVSLARKYNDDSQASFAKLLVDAGTTSSQLFTFYGSF